MSVNVHTSDDYTGTEIEQRLRVSLDKARATAQDRYRNLSLYVAQRPVRSIVMALLLGVATARLFSMLD